MLRTLIVIILLGLCQSALAATYAVVISSHVQIEKLGEHKVKDIFLKKRGFSNGIRLISVNLLGDGQARKDFEMRVLHMNRDELNRDWISSHFQGISPPATQASLLSIKRFIENVNGAIGYMPMELVDDRLKVVYEF